MSTIKRLKDEVAVGQRTMQVPKVAGGRGDAPMALIP
jgi:hypothetical protein